MTTALQCSNVTKTYRFGFLGKKVQALQGVDLEVAEGELFGLIGPNGAGKSTTIKILLDLVRPTSGTATLFGIDARNPAARERVSYVPESPVPYEHLTGREYVELQAALARIPPAQTSAEVKRVIERVEMSKAAKMSIRRYSKGMTQRIMLAGALLGAPRLVILDEPTSGLDPLGRRLVRDLILELRNAGSTVLFCTHIISDVESLCDRAALMIGGRVQRSGRIDQLVTLGNKTHEVVVEGATLETVRAALGGLEARVETTPSGCFIHVVDELLQTTLARLSAAQLRITRVQPERFTLEETFLEALKSVPGTMGANLE